MMACLQITLCRCANCLEEERSPRRCPAERDRCEEDGNHGVYPCEGALGPGDYR